MFSSKFSHKCKHAAKNIRERVEPITKKKQATLRILKKDVADLLAAGRDDSAFGRIDAIIVETNHTSCYSTIEKCCEYIVRQLPSLERQRECSPEVMEVIGTLVFAAARFPDLPELCDLRRIFMERYGCDMQSSANAEFVEKLQKKTFSKEKKLQLMQSIAGEFYERWDSQTFGRKLSDPPVSKSDPTKKGVPSNADDKPTSTVASRNNEIIPSGDKSERIPATLPRRQEEEAKVVNMVSTSKNVPLRDPQKEINEVAAANEPESVKRHASRPEAPPNVNSRSSSHEAAAKDSTEHGRRPKTQYELNSVEQDKQRLDTGKYLDDEPAKSVPPYTKSSENKNDSGAKGNGLPSFAQADETKSVYAVDHEQKSEPPPHQGMKSTAKPAGNNLSVAKPYVKLAKDSLTSGDKIVNNVSVETTPYVKDSLIRSSNVDKPKPVSVRRNFRNLPPRETATFYDRDRNYDEKIFKEDSTEDERANVVGNAIPMPRTSRVQKEERSRHSSADVYDGKSDTGGRGYEVKQNTSVHDERKISRQQVNKDEKDNAIDYGNLFARTSNGHDDEEEMMTMKKGKARTGFGHPSKREVPPSSGRREPNPPPPERVLSVPPQPVSPEAIKTPARTVSMQPDLLAPNGGRVHPRLPDFDSLAARLAALRNL